MKGSSKWPSIFPALLVALFSLPMIVFGQCGCCDEGCCGGCWDCECGCGPIIQIQLPQRNGSSQSGCPPGLNIPQQQGGGEQQQQNASYSSSPTMNDQIPKMVAELIAQDLIGKMNGGGNEEEGKKSKEEEEERQKKSRPKAKSKDNRSGERGRKRRQAVWPLGPNHSHLHQPAGGQLSEQELEEKFQKVLFLQQRPLTPLQAEPPPLQPPEFPVPIQPDENSPSNPPKTTKMGPLRVIHVKPTSLGKFALMEGKFEFEEGDHDLKHPFEEPFQ